MGFSKDFSNSDCPYIVVKGNNLPVNLLIHSVTALIQTTSVCKTVRVTLSFLKKLLTFK